MYPSSLYFTQKPTHDHPVGCLIKENATNKKSGQRVSASGNRKYTIEVTVYQRQGFGTRQPVMPRDTVEVHCTGPLALRDNRAWWIRIRFQFTIDTRRNTLHDKFNSISWNATVAAAGTATIYLTVATTKTTSLM